MNSEVCLLEHEETGPAAPGQVPADYPRAWTPATLREADYRFAIPAACLAELEAVADALRRDPLPTLVLKPAMFSLEACRGFMARVRAALEQGVGLALLERLPLELYSQDQAVALYWVLASLLGRPVAQKWNGLMIYDVKDTTGVAPGDGVRASLTNAELSVHTDNQFGQRPPQYVGLLCLHTARSGGESTLISWNAVYHELTRRHPALVARGFRPFLFDRQHEHAPGEALVISRPVFRFTDRLETCYYSRVMRTGHEMAGQALDAEGREFLDAVDGILEEPGFRREFHFEPGQIQLINNATVGHARTDFQDHADPARKRHLIRLWIREHGRISFNG